MLQKNLFGKVSGSLFLLFCGLSEAQTLVHYWNFNNNSSQASITAPTLSLINGSSVNAVAGGSSVIDFAGGNGQNFNVDNLNARNGDPSGTHLRFNNPIGGALVFSLPTTGFQNPVIKFSTRRSGSGAGTQNWSYTTDGTNYISYTSVSPADGNPILQTFDFTGVANVSDNPNFKLKVEFATGGGGNVGNNRFDNFTMDAFAAGGADTTAPVATITPANGATGVSTAVHPEISFNENVRLVDNSPITNANAVNIIQLKNGNAAGASIPFSATVSGNSIQIIPASPLNPNTPYYVALLPNTVEDFSDNAVTSIYSTTFTTAATTVSMASNFVKVNENAGTLNFILNVSSPANATVNLVAKPAPYSTAGSADFTFTSQTIQITPSSPAQINVSIPIIDDASPEQQAEYFVLSLENPVGTVIGGDPNATVYIIDNDTPTPVASKQIELNYIGSFDPSGSNTATTEIVAYDAASQRLFTTSALSNQLHIINFSNPAAPAVINTIDMTPYGGLTSVAVKNGIVAAASPNVNPQLDGSVVFFDTNGIFQKQVTVGALPDMINFTPDGTKILTANEGEPNLSYSVDPEGSVSIIDISGGIAGLTQSNVTTLLFTSYNAQEASLVAGGVRKLKASSTLSQDLEPEYIAVSADSQKAWVTLQENNAVAEINLNTKTYTNLWALGKKDMSLPGNGFDASDNNGEVLIANWPVKSFYIPDAVATYKAGNANYLVTANEGDEKEFSALNERTTVGAESYTLDPAVFPQASVLKANHNLGRFRVTNLNGNLDADAQFEEINSVGARSFSIFNADTKQIVFDSGDLFERYTAAEWPSVFNSDHESNSPKNRSRSKGPEPEGVALGTIGGETFAFVSLERVGGVMIYNITNPNAPSFVDYKNTRTTSTYGGDNGAEGILYIPATATANGKPHVIVANEISGTLTIYEVDQKTLSVQQTSAAEPKTFAVFPNPVSSGNFLYFNRATGYSLFDASGKLVKSESKATQTDTSGLATGVYYMKTSEGISKKIIVK